MRTPLIALALLVLAVGTARAIDYRHEVDLHVIEPCIEAALRDAGGVSGLSEREAIDLLKILNERDWEGVRRTTIPLVTGRSDAARAAAYVYAREQCIRSALGR